MAGTLHAFEFLAQADEEATAAAKGKAAFPPVVVLFGDEDFLRQLVKQRLRHLLLNNHPDAPYSTLDGESAQWCDVADEVSTVALFGGGAKRLVIVEKADDFVSKFRTKLEDYVEKPKSSGILVLEVDSWASSTRLYKAVDKKFLQVDVRLPMKSSGKSVDEPRLLGWIVEWAQTHHGFALSNDAARLLVDLAGPHLGMLDQELAKLALFADGKKKVTPAQVQSVVGGWKVEAIWDVVDAAANGDAATALRQLDLALQSGEHPLALFGQISWSLRRYTVATRIFEEAELRGRKIPLREALLQAGFRQWPADALQKAEKQIIQLGRERAGKLLGWLLELDLALKLSHSTEDRGRFALEQLFLRMAKPQPARAR